MAAPLCEGTRAPDISRLSTVTRFPLMTHQVALAIYWQALQLWWKGAKYYPHPVTPNRISLTQETTVR